MKKIAIIGANEFQKKLVLKAKNMGIETHVFAWEEGAVAKEVSDYFYPISIMEKDKILEKLRLIDVNGVCSIASDLAMPTVNYLANELRLVGNSQKCTILTTNKYEMRKKLKEKGMPIPEFQLIKNEQDIDFDKIKFPAIVKPIDRSGSRGIYKVMNLDELRMAIQNARGVSFIDSILVEEYIEGKEYSIEGISQKGKHKIIQVTEKFTSGAPNFIESAHLSPARIDGDLKKRIFKTIEESLKALKVENGASHSEIKVSPEGDIKIIEIAARMGGDFIGSDMVEISTGFDFVKNVIKAAMAETICFKHNASDKLALVKFIFDNEDIKKLEILKNKYPATIKEYFIDSQIMNVTDSSTRNGHYILEINDQEQLKDVLNILGIEN
ncbi:ATP-grasp domain-containing protein [Anoxynatronum sibiricum]|uniref:ATP-grasp domain-containing protein n=1 Tax=Anoxynatronum sibiricum TaxID=210623 RepID=A0ABU9VXZ3_9CLOT